MAAPIPLSIAAVVISIISVGVYDFMTNFENNGCEMTYMYEYPQYQKIDLAGTEKMFSSYGLYVYGEGSYANKIRNLQLDGVPVLFIPGNAGSHKQVRSLGSVALRMSELPNVKNHFNYFVVDFDEELSGLYGGVLTKQTEFVHLCVKKIMSLYHQSKFPPSSVVLVGHSMGGMVARALFTLPDFDHSWVNTIITQATPHQKPVIALDVELYNLYSQVNQYWRDHSTTRLQHVTVVSSGGGYRDIQVQYALTTLDGIVSPNRAVSVSTTSVAKAWVSTDHLCAVWCRQMVLLTQRALFDILDKSTQQVSNDADLRIKVFRHHFVTNNALPNYLTHKENKTIDLDPKINWEIKRERFWTFTSRQMSAAQYLALPLVVEEGKDAVLIQSNLSIPDWLCYCDIPAGHEKCSICTSLSSRSQLLPPLYSKAKYVRLTHRDINITNNTHIVIIVPVGEKQVNIISDRYNSNERHLIYHMPSTYDTLLSFPVSTTDGAALLKISNASTFYSLHLAGLTLPTNAYTAVIIPQACRKHSTEMYQGSVLRMNVPWSHEDTYTFASYGKEARLPIKLQTGRPADYDWRLDASEPHLEMFLHPYCHYQLRLLLATQDSLGQAVRFYAVLWPGYFVAVLLVVLRGVLIAHGKGQVAVSKCQSPADGLFVHGKPYFMIPVLGLRFIMRFGPVTSLLTKFGVPKDDSSSLTEQGLYFTLLPLLLYSSAWLVTYLQTWLAFTLLTVLSYLGRLVAWLPNGVTEKVGWLYLIISGLAVLASIFCGTLAVLLTSALLIVKIVHLLYVIGQKLDSFDTHGKLMYYLPVMLLVNWQVLLSLASFVTWMKQAASTQFGLTPDPSRLPAVIVCVCVSLLFWIDDVIPTRPQADISGWLLYGLAIVVILYATESLYRLSTLISLAIFIFTIPKLLGFVNQRLRSEHGKGD